MGPLTTGEIAELSSLCPGGVSLNVDLSEISQWKIGGRAAIMLRPASKQEITLLLRWFSERAIRPLVIGSTTNLLFSDDVLRTPCIQIGSRMSGTTFNGSNVTADAGVWVPHLARRILQHKLAGAEHICGIPGSLGGLICMNGGSQRKGISCSIVSVESVNLSGHIINRSRSECGFAYRRSVFQRGDEIITSAHLRFEPGLRASIHSEMCAILADRRRKFPRKEPNCGSVFKSNPTMYSDIGPPGAAIERLGFKGKRIGGAMVSTRHANFIVNTGGATSKDVLTLISIIQESVLAETGYRMEAETCFVSADGKIQPADTVLNKVFI